MLTRSLIFVFAVLMSCIAPASSQTTRLDLLGNAAPANIATRTIVITPDTKWVNVVGGEVIHFVVGDKSFTWDFFVGFTVSSFNLQLVAPPGLLQRPVIAYVSPDPRYSGPD